MRRLGFERSTLRSYTDGEEVRNTTMLLSRIIMLLIKPCEQRGVGVSMQTQPNSCSLSQPQTPSSRRFAVQVLPGLFHLAESMYLFLRQ